MSHINQIESMVRGMFDCPVAVAATSLSQIAPAVFPVEAATLRGAVPGRRNEFALGRSMARKAMRTLGLGACAIPVAPDRAPIWPDGLSGSISHGGGVCVSVVSVDPAVSGLGIDVDSTAPLPADLWKIVCDSTEQDWLTHQPLVAQGRLAKLIFCAKEAAYKSQYPVSKRLFGFEGFHISVDLQAGRFTARFTECVSPFRRGETLQGRFHVVDSVIICAVAVVKTCRTVPELSEMVA